MADVFTKLAEVIIRVKISPCGHLQMFNSVTMTSGKIYQTSVTTTVFPGTPLTLTVILHDQMLVLANFKPPIV